MTTGVTAVRTSEVCCRPGPEEPPGLAEEFQTVRRLDWRFLLPNPALDRVAFVGCARGSLLETLRHFSDALVEFEGSGAVTCEPFSLVVTQNPSRSELLTCASLTAPGGALYAEFSRNVLPPARWGGLARRAGFSDVRLYWHWPDFEACTRMVPLEDAATLVFTIRNKHTPIKAAIAAAGVRWLQWTHLIGWVASDFSLVAVKR